MALNDLSVLLSNIGQDDDAKRIRQLKEKAKEAVDEKLWSQKDGCYLNKQETHDGGGEGKYSETFTEDSSFYLAAMTADTQQNILRMLAKGSLG